MAATRTALRMPGRRVLALDEEKARTGALLAPLVTATAPQLLTVSGAGVGTAAALLVTAGITPGGCGPRRPGRTCAAPRLYPHPPAR